MLGDSLLKKPWIGLVSFPNITIHGHDCLMKIVGLELSYNSPEGNFPFQLENGSVFEGFVVFEPSVNGLYSLNINRKPLEVGKTHLDSAIPQHFCRLIFGYNIWTIF
jgi:hypothetical protein